ncbi:MAG TPA: DNA ligase, partial [Actinobacteria bacterium]|nr:DNA ligase [Actinomycetota bacterium]
YSGGRPLLDLPYRERRARLDRLGGTGRHWQIPPAFAEEAGVQVQAV